MILSYGCSTALGPSVQDFWNGLRGPAPESPRRWPNQSSSLQQLTRHGSLAWEECRRNAPPLADRLGVIFASTKGCIDDWSAGDPIASVLQSFLTAAELRPTLATAVSNACASSLTALFLGRLWIQQGRVDQVLILAADRAGPFVERGFETLKILSPKGARPFSPDRDGLWLGDGAAAILLGREGGAFRITGVGTETEGFSVTRPNRTGESLRRVCSALPGLPHSPPDLVIAHGTGTRINDETEDLVFDSLFGEISPPVTGTKWCIGHTLGASAAMDLIAACESIRHRKAFTLGATEAADPAFRSRYLTAGSPLADSLLPSRVLVSSLGFGGVCAAAMVEKAGAP